MKKLTEKQEAIKKDLKKLVKGLEKKTGCKTIITLGPKQFDKGIAPLTIWSDSFQDENPSYKDLVARVEKAESEYFTMLTDQGYKVNPLIEYHKDNDLYRGQDRSWYALVIRVYLDK